MRVKMRLGDLLVTSGIITKDQLELALIEQKKSGVKLGEALIELNFVTETQIAKTLAAQLDLPYIDLAVEVPAKEALAVFNDSTYLQNNSFIPVRFNQNNSNQLLVTVADPSNIILIDDLTSVTGFQIEVAVSPAGDIENAISKYYGSVDAQNAAAEFMKANTEENDTSNAENTEELSAAQVIVENILKQAIILGASDIHIEPGKHRMIVRYRVDGVLQDDESSRYQMQMYRTIVSRIKIMSSIRIDESRVPQDGKCEFTLGVSKYDIRVSTLPCVYGEKVVMRIIAQIASIKSIADLGLTQTDEERLKYIFSRPNGIILVTGPTGSGKSTTLYAVLNQLNTREVNIVTVEDPVEATVKGLNQVPINHKANMTFASALRSILRQDPDIIMVGEIRDQETADIAITASITGHLVASTLHTNSSAAAITRLIDMGAEPYLLSDALAGIVAQRLVRRLCPDCKREDLATPEENLELGLDKDAKTMLYRPCGCPRCKNSGYNGRIGIYEIMPVTKKIQQLITKNAATSDIESSAAAEGMRTLHDSAAELVKSGITSINELLRVAPAERIV